MSFTDHQKLNALWKAHRGVSPTSSSKAAHNEQYLSQAPTFQKDFWTDSDIIPIPAPRVDVPVGNELWFDIMVPYKDVNALPMVMDSTTQGTGWRTVLNFEDGLVDANLVKNWIPDVFDRTYTVSVWAGKPGSTTITPVRLSAVAEGYEWLFDYKTGILFFPNGVPPVVMSQGIWIEGWNYTGSIGRQALSSGGGNNTSKIRTFTFTSGLLAPGVSADFTFATGGKCILVEAKTSSTSTLECHATSARTDTNPYRFKAIDTHLVDDGSYSVAGTRYYGERFVPLINMEDTTSEFTYWRIINDSTSPNVITVIVSVA